MRDLVDAQLVEVAEDDDHAIEIGQLPHGRADPRAILACHRLRVRRGIRVGNGRRLLDLDAAPQLAPALAHVADRFVRRDAQQPVPERPRPIVAMEGSIRLEEGRARNVERRVPVARDAERDAVDLVLVLADAIGERRGRGQGHGQVEA